VLPSADDLITARPGKPCLRDCGCLNKERWLPRAGGEAGPEFTVNCNLYVLETCFADQCQLFRRKVYQKLWTDPGKFWTQQACFALFANVTQANIGVEVLRTIEPSSVPSPPDYPLPRLTVKRYDHVFSNPQLVRTSPTSYSKYDYP
jgi:hypothetical protein